MHGARERASRCDFEAPSLCCRPPRKSPIGRADEGAASLPSFVRRRPLDAIGECQIEIAMRMELGMEERRPTMDAVARKKTRRAIFGRRASAAHAQLVIGCLFIAKLNLIFARRGS